ncbi:hypothetical protein [Vibrio phage vB_VpaP_SJSY21]|nr:hypothetical protein [Vibrio phage vB_VpaP_SJSY21]
MLSLFTKFNLIKRIYYNYFEKKLEEELNSYLDVPYKISLIEVEGRYFLAADFLGKRYYRDGNSKYRLLPNSHHSLYIDASFPDVSSAIKGSDELKILVESKISAYLHNKEMGKRLARARKYL